MFIPPFKKSHLLGEAQYLQVDTYIQIIIPMFQIYIYKYIYIARYVDYAYFMHGNDIHNIRNNGNCWMLLNLA